jgi:uncharacterized protein (DUF2237 family)
MCIEKNALNVLGTKLLPCSSNPITGFYRDGFCKTFENDVGEHIICSEVTTKFLLFSKSKGNDLSTAIPEYDFKGLNNGDRWCLCADRWIEALKNNVAPKILLEATHIKMLDKIDFNTLKRFGIEYMNLN